MEDSTQHLLSVLIEEAPRIQAASLCVLEDLKTRQHPYYIREFGTFQESWNSLKNSLNTMLSHLGAECMQGTTIHTPCNFTQEKHILKVSVHRIWKTTDNLSDSSHGFVKNERQVLMHSWTCLDSSLDRLINPDMAEKIYFCCELQCFPCYSEGVDGIACQKCMACSFCQCDCVMYMKYRRDTHCCPLFCCRPTFGECILCPGACLCPCKSQLQNGQTVRMNGREIKVVEYRGNETHCCEKKCFPMPDQIFRGLACLKCKAVNYCKCGCMSWKAKQKESYMPLVRPDGGWETVTEKDWKPWKRGVYFEETLRNHYFSTNKDARVSKDGQHERTAKGFDQPSDSHVG
ncbi:hypothetical protein JTE90_005447 [Oedothorax gibbosus]|uniref:Uncharacterized protein n=1 Tax=Oedothorax gibbosus TaxID=931172 RepID=A0AAV6TIV3_9ARAC|nr:hypothetical protein JTE90_005447 [Oedothorax gibbosus]